MESAGLKLAYLLIQPFEGANWRSAIRVVFPSKELSYSRLCRWIPVADGKKITNLGPCHHSFSQPGRTPAKRRACLGVFSMIFGGQPSAI